jgi:hypothetical protein
MSNNVVFEPSENFNALKKVIVNGDKAIIKALNQNCSILYSSIMSKFSNTSDALMEVRKENKENLFYHGVGTASVINIVEENINQNINRNFMEIDARLRNIDTRIDLLLNKHSIIEETKEDIKNELKNDLRDEIDNMAKYYSDFENDMPHFNINTRNDDYDYENICDDIIILDD